MSMTTKPQNRILLHILAAFIELQPGKPDVELVAEVYFVHHVLGHGSEANETDC